MYKTCMLNISKDCFMNATVFLVKNQMQLTFCQYSLYKITAKMQPLECILNTCLNLYLFPSLYFNLLSSLEDEYSILVF